MDGRIVNVSVPDSTKVNVNPLKELPELNIDTRTGHGAILKPIIKTRPDTYQGEVKQVIDCVSWNK